MFTSNMVTDTAYVCLQAANPGDNSTRTVIESPKYTQVVIYDHITRRKT